jgi:tetratricopeptide (TPR) repeat protein
MSNLPINAPTPTWASRIAPIFLQALGLVLALLATWRLGWLLVEVDRYPNSPSCWLELGSTTPLWLLSCLGGFWLVRCKATGFLAFYAVLFLSLVGWVTPRLLPTDRLLPTGFDWPLPTGRMNLILLVVLVSAQIMTRKSWSEGRRSYLKMGIGACLALLVTLGCRYRHAGIEQAAGEMVQRGIKSHEAGDPEKALAQWERVVERYAHTSAWGVAVYNSGVVHKELGRQQEAIALFERLLAGPVNDLEPGANLMETYRNYRHYACLGLSECYEQMGDRQEALRYARLARDRYRFQSWCGTCLMQAAKEVEDRISRLERLAGE